MSFITQPLTLLPIRDARKVGDINLNVVISENTTDRLTITNQPVQQGTSITDHSFKEPTALTMAALFEANLFVSLSAVYQKLLDLQESRTPFVVVTPKRVYQNMLISSLGLTTDKNTENTLAINFTFQQIIIVNVSTTTVPRDLQKVAAATGKTEKAGRKSALLILKEAVSQSFANNGGA